MVEEQSQDRASTRYDSLKDQGLVALEAGRLRQALELFDRAYELAVADGDENLRDLAVCNCAAVAIRLGEAEALIPRLRAMLMRTRDPRVSLFSAYNLALDCNKRKRFRKALFYARIAERYATELGEEPFRASALNEVGNAFVALNDFDSALEAYLQAETLVAGEETGRHATFLANIGYCHLLQGRLDDGFRREFESLRMARRCGARLAESLPRLCLSFAHLLANRPGHALRHANGALELAEEQGDHETVKYALLLLGEGYKKGGRTAPARECFQLLQRTFYPDMPEVPPMLLDVDVCRVINLRA